MPVRYVNHIYTHLTSMEEQRAIRSDFITAFSARMWYPKTNPVDLIKAAYGKKAEGDGAQSHADNATARRTLEKMGRITDGTGKGTN